MAKLTKAQALKRCKEAQNKLIAVCGAFPKAAGQNYKILADAMNAIDKIRERVG